MFFTFPNHSSLLQTTALHVCFLLLDITLALQDASKAAVSFLPQYNLQLTSTAGSIELVISFQLFFVACDILSKDVPENVT